MKKFFVFLGLAVLAVAPSYAVMDSQTFTLQAIATATNSRTLVLRGELEAVKVDVVGVSTGSINVATAELTAFNKTAIGADATFLPRSATHTTAGVAATFVGGTNDTANTVYAKIPLAGEVTVRLIGETAAATTNNMIVTLVYKK